MEEEETEVKPCSNPGCDEPGTKSCSACYSSAYCGVSCQTADWPKHKEECDGHLRKVGKANFDKASGFRNQRNWVQSLRYAEIAATKLKQLKDRRLETVKLIDKTLGYKFDCLGMLCRYKEAKDVAEERYTLWAMNQMRNPGSINAAFGLIQSCLTNKEYEDAENYARHAMFMIKDMNDNFIPSDQQPKFIADASYYLARALHRLAEGGDIPPEKKQKAGEEAIASARHALELRTQLSGIYSNAVAMVMVTLADVLDIFNNVDDDEVLRLYEQAIAIQTRVEGSTSSNVAANNCNLGRVYYRRAKRARYVNDFDRYVANLEKALPHFCESARIYGAINQVASSNRSLRFISLIEECIGIETATQK